VVWKRKVTCFAGKDDPSRPEKAGLGTSKEAESDRGGSQRQGGAEHAYTRVIASPVFGQGKDLLEKFRCIAGTSGSGASSIKRWNVDGGATEEREENQSSRRLTTVERTLSLTSRKGERVLRGPSSRGKYQNNISMTERSCSPGGESGGATTGGRRREVLKKGKGPNERESKGNRRELLPRNLPSDDSLITKKLGRVQRLEQTAVRECTRCRPSQSKRGNSKGPQKCRRHG